MKGRCFFRELIIPLIITFSFTAHCSAQTQKEPSNGWNNLRNETPQWFKNAKFGIYFHWGPYTVPAFNSEWYSRNMYIPGTKAYKHELKTYGPLSKFGYKNFIPMFKGQYFNANRWAELFVKAGAKFAGLVAIHADGFSMWNSKVNPWNAKKMGPKIDVVGEMDKAIKGHGLKFITTFHNQWHYAWYPTFNKNVDAGNPKYSGLYGPLVSQYDWKHINKATNPSAKFCKKWAREVLEVVKGYKPDILYFDSRLNIIKDKYRKMVVTRFLANFRNLNKKGVVLSKQQALPDDVSVKIHEKSSINKISKRVWVCEEPISTFSWGYTKGMKIRTASNILYSLIDAVSKNGIFLLNISPMSNGIIPNNQKKVLLKLGKWLNKYGESIYGTRPWYTYGGNLKKWIKENSHKKYYNLQYNSTDIRYTQKGHYIYAILMGKPASGKWIFLNAFNKKKVPNTIITKIRMLGIGQKIKWKYKDNKLAILIPSTIPSTMANVFKITYSNKI